MKTYLLSILLIVGLVSCKEQKPPVSDVDNNPNVPDAVVTENQKLYNDVMKIHDEAMAKMDAMYLRKKELQNTLKTSGLSDTDKKKIEGQIVALDSASEGMMVWMRTFKPLPDTADEDEARKYLETEMESVKKVRDRILKALENTKE